MRTKPDIRLRRIGSRFMIVDTRRQQDATAVHSLNATAAAIWEYASEKVHFSVADIARFLTDNFEVDSLTAATDAARLVDQWKREGLLLPQ